MTELISLTIIYLALSALIIDPRNPRYHSTRQIRQIARSIQNFGWVVPILIDCHNRIVAGHGRYFAAQLLKIDVVPVIRLEHLSDTQLKALRIADNRLTETSIWNESLLAETFKELS
jgi:ParB-like chromosome segregation protein Spo0J